MTTRVPAVAGAGGFLSGAALAITSYVQKDLGGLITGASVALGSLFSGVLGHVRALEADIESMVSVGTTAVAKVDPTLATRLTAVEQKAEDALGKANNALSHAAADPAQLEAVANRAVELLKAKL